MTILVTGGAGYIGAHVVKLLHDQGERVVVVDDLSTGDAGRIGSARLEQYDLAAPDALDRLVAVMTEEKVNAVIHFAARKQVGESVQRPQWYYQQNVGGMVTLLTAMQTAGVSRLVFSSSAAVYGMPELDTVTEKTQTEPINPYGQTKLAGEWLARAAATAWGLRFVGLRYFNVAGAASPKLGDRAALNLVPMVFDRMAQGQQPVIFGADYPTADGTCVRDYVHVVDLAGAHVAALGYLDREDRQYDVFNVGTGTGSSVRQVISAIAEASGMALNPVIAERRAGDPPRLVASCERIAEELGWTAQRDLRDIVESAWSAWQAGPRAVRLHREETVTPDRF